MGLNKKILLIIIVLFIILKGLEELYDFFLLENRNIKSSYITKEKMDAEVLILGPCVPLWMISPKILDEQTGLKSFNLAQSHSDLADNFLHLHLYLQNNLPPKFLLLYISPESFDEKYNAFNTYRFVPFIKDSLVKAVIKNQDPSYSKWLCFPFMRYGYYNNNINFNFLQGIKHFITGQKKPYFEDGFEPPFEIWKNDKQDFVESYPANEDFKWSQGRASYLSKIIETCLLHKVKLILFESPVYNESAKKQLSRAIFINRIKEISKRQKIEYINFDNTLISNYKYNFKTTINLNQKAAEDFTIIFGKYLKTSCF